MTHPLRHFSQIGNVDVCVNVDIASHPVECSPPRFLYFSFLFELKAALAFSIFMEKAANNKEANITQKEKKIFLALDFKFCGVKVPTG